jgi:YfiH family protein
MPTLALESLLLRRLGVRHGFSTRQGGVSEGPFATLNLAVSPGDDPAAVAENFRRFSAAIGVLPERLFQTSQVHGSSVREIVGGDVREAVVQEQHDALVARASGDAIGVRVADCVPVLLFDEATGDVAAAHAGWRGVVGGVVTAAVAQLCRYAPPRAVAAAIGPSIGACCFEVGDDVAAMIDDAAPGDASLAHAGPHAKPHVDLRLAIRRQLRALGVDDARIDDVEGCTRCDAERFFSYRRDGAKSGRHLAAIAAR